MLDMKYCIVNKNDSLSKELYFQIKEKIKLEYSEKNPDLVVAIGGDGTIIKTVHRYPKAIIFGVHTGHLGFLSNYTKENINTLIEDINGGKYKVEKLGCLECHIKDDKQDIVAYALNELTIIMPPRTLILDVLVDNNKLETFRGTGLCISTSYGSTAYNKSLHGAIVDPNIKSIQVTEIAGINSNAYRTLGSSLVLDSKRLIELRSLKPEDLYVTVDNLSYHLEKFNSAKICLKEEMIKFGCHSIEQNFLERMHKAFLKEEKNSIN